MQSVIHLKSNTFDLFPPVYAVQNDTGRELKMILDDVTLAGTETGAVAIRRSDGSYYTITATLVAADNAFTIEADQALTQPGKTECQLKVTDSNNDVISSYTFCIMVQPSTDGVPQEQLGVTAQELIDAAAQLTLSDNDVKLALLQIAEKVVYIDPNGQDYYDALEAALYPPIRATGVTLDKNSLVFSGIGGTDTLTATVSPNNVEDPTVYWGSSDKDVAVVSDGIVTAVAVGTCTITATCGTKHASASVSVTSATLLSISAAYTQSGTVYDTDALDDLKADLIVTAYYDDSTHAIVPAADYTLSGTLTAGTSTITVTYGDKTDTFTVTVTHQTIPAGYTAYDYLVNGGTDSQKDYVDIGTYGTSNFAVLDMELEGMNTNSSTSSEPLLGYKTSANADYKNFDWYMGKGGTYASCFALQSGAKQFTVAANTRFVLKYNFSDGAATTVAIDDGTPTTIFTLNASQVLTQPYNLYLCGHRTQASGVVGCAGGTHAYKLGMVRFTDQNGDAVYEFIPVKNESTGEYGFYDTVGNQFYPQHSSYLVGGYWS